VFSISDVWVAAATRDDDAYSTADWDNDNSSVIEHDVDSDIEANSDIENDPFGYDMDSERPSLDDLRGRAQIPIRSRHNSRASEAFSPLRDPRLSFTTNMTRRGSTYSSTYGGRVPAIFNNTGLGTSPARSPGPAPMAALRAESASYDQSTAPASATTSAPATATAATAAESSLPAIPENKPATTAALPGPAVDSAEKPSTWSQLPTALVVQHAVLAFHGTTMDQVFMSFLVTPVGSGGLGLTAGHYAELVAVMCVCNMIFQFRFVSMKLGLYILRNSSRCLVPHGWSASRKTFASFHVPPRACALHPGLPSLSRAEKPEWQWMGHVRHGGLVRLSLPCERLLVFRSGLSFADFLLVDTEMFSVVAAVMILVRPIV
jgi:hypothetical protein